MCLRCGGLTFDTRSRAAAANGQALSLTRKESGILEYLLLNRGRPISQEELMRDHAGIPHGGFVIRTGSTGWNDENGHVIEYSLKLDSNPEFTASVIAAYARAAYRLSREGQSGCKTVFDIAPAYLSAADGAELRKHLL